MAETGEQAAGWRVLSRETDGSVLQEFLRCILRCHGVFNNRFSCDRAGAIVANSFKKQMFFIAKGRIDAGRRYAHCAC